MAGDTHIQSDWERAVRTHAEGRMVGPEGAYCPIGSSSRKLLNILLGGPRPRPDIGALLRAGGTVKFWSDPHFGHDNIRRLAPRPEFDTLAAMDGALMEAAVEAAASADLVVCLGDAALREPLAVHRRLQAAMQGRHVLLVGNHDAKGSSGQEWLRAGAFGALAFSVPLALVRGWIEADEPDLAAAVDWSRLPTELAFGLCHWPLPPVRFPGVKWLQIHGHVHAKPARPLRANCSVEAIGYRPKTLRELVSATLLDDLARRIAHPTVFAASDDAVEDPAAPWEAETPSPGRRWGGGGRRGGHGAAGKR